MKEIYASSSETLVWLGPADEMTDTAFIHLGSLSQSWEVRPPHLKRIDILDEDLEEYRNLFHSECVNDDLIQPWRAIQFVACRSWFERAWVMQEVGVARMVIFMCGNRMIPWRTLINTGAVIVQHNSMLNRSIDIESHGRREILEALTRAIRSMQEFSKNSASYRSKTLLRGDDGLITILNQLRSMQATDPRDKVYAALGLVDIDTQTLLVDYSLPVETVYSRVTQRSCESSQSFHVLVYCRFPLNLHPCQLGLRTGVTLGAKSCRHYLRKALTDSGGRRGKTGYILLPENQISMYASEIIAAEWLSKRVCSAKLPLHLLAASANGT